jgi:hypothetical protein
MLTDASFYFKGVSEMFDTSILIDLLASLDFGVANKCIDRHEVCHFCPLLTKTEVRENKVANKLIFT